MKTPILIRDLGLKDFGSYRKRVGLFVCPFCKNAFETRTNSVQSGNTTSCGCDRKGNLKHGGKHTRIYNCWLNMKQRVSKSADAKHKRHYAGIKVCREWATDFEAFRDWALEAGYGNGLVLDRINPRKDYEPSNCRWITQSENAKRAMDRRYGRAPE